MNQFPRFPVWGTTESIPWAVIEPHRSQAFKNHAMSLTMLAQRGGLDWAELLAVLNDRPFRRVVEAEARRQVEEIATIFMRGAKPEPSREPTAVFVDEAQHLPKLTGDQSGDP